MTVALDAVGPAGGAGVGGLAPSSPITWTHICAPASVLFVGIAIGTAGHNDADMPITAVTYGGVPLNLIGLVHPNQLARGYVSIWVLGTPPPGSATVSVSFTRANPNAGDSIAAGSVSFVGADREAAPYFPVNTATNTGSGASPSVSVLSRPGDMVLDAVACGHGITSSSTALEWKKNVGTGNAAGNAAQSIAPGAASVAMGYTVTSDVWGMIAVDVRQGNMGNIADGVVAGPDPGLSQQVAAAFAMMFNGASWDRQRFPNVFKTLSAVAVNTEVTIWTPTSGKKFRLMGFVLTSTGASGNVALKDNTGGTTILTIPFSSIGDSKAIPYPGLGNGILSAASNNVLTALGQTGQSISGFLMGLEE
jgi:hypothetical protein